MKRRSIAVAVLALALVAGGCPKSAYHSAVVAEHQFTTVLKSFQQAELVEHQNGRIDDAEHKVLEAGIEKVATAAQVLVTSLQAGAANTTVQQNFATVSQAVNDLMAQGIAVKNPTSQALVKAVLQSAQAILTNVQQLLSAQPATGGK